MLIKCKFTNLIAGRLSFGHAFSLENQINFDITCIINILIT